MSIVAMKRKSATQYNNMSVGQKQFSLNGTHRSQGYVGQSVISRSLPRTLFNGNVPRGHGGCCGYYPQAHVIQSATTSTNNVNVVKPSVLSNEGMIATKYRWITRPKPYISLKPDSTLNSNTQDEYIRRLKNITLNKTPDLVPKNPPHYVQSNRYETHKTSTDITKPESTFTAMDQSNYIERKTAKCNNCKENYYFMSPTKGSAFACGIAHK